MTASSRRRPPKTCSSPAPRRSSPSIPQIPAPPVQPSKAITTKAGLTKAFCRQFRLDVNYFRRARQQLRRRRPDRQHHHQLSHRLRKAIVYGAEGKLDLPDWQSILRLPELLLRGRQRLEPRHRRPLPRRRRRDAEHQLTGHVPDSQDQRNTIRGRLRYQVKSALLGRRRSAIRYRPSLRIRRRPRHGARRNTASRFSIASTSRAAASTFVPSQCVCRHRPLPLRSHEHEAPSRRRKSNQRPRRHRFGGLFSGNAIGPPAAPCCA